MSASCYLLTVRGVGGLLWHEMRMEGASGIHGQSILQDSQVWQKPALGPEP